MTKQRWIAFGCAKFPSSMRGNPLCALIDKAPRLFALKFLPKPLVFAGTSLAVGRMYADLDLHEFTAHGHCNKHVRKTPAWQIMSTSVVTVTENDSIERVLELILKYDINRIPVVKDRKPVGIVARRDLLIMMNVNQTKATQAVGST